MIGNFNEFFLSELDVSEMCCAYCGRKMNYIKGHSYQFTVDHIIPKSNGGTNCDLNRLPCCRTCNSMKADNSLDYFLSQIIFRLSVNIEGSKNSLKRWTHTMKNVLYIKENITKYKKEVFRYSRNKLMV
jgi:hypothetical protein